MAKEKVEDELNERKRAAEGIEFVSDISSSNLKPASTEEVAMTSRVDNDSVHFTKKAQFQFTPSGNKIITIHFMLFSYRLCAFYSFKR